MKRLSAVISGIAFMTLAVLTPVHAGAQKNEFGIEVHNPDPAIHANNMLTTECARGAGMRPGTNITPEQLRIFTACVDAIRLAAKTKR
jgi:hypothetical protein